MVSGKLRKSIVFVSVALVFSVFGSGGCVGAPQQGAVCDGPDACGDPAEDGVAGVATPIPVADATEPTPVIDPVEGEPGTGTVVTGDGGAGVLVWLPWLGWGSTIDLLDLLATGGLGDALEPATDNPGSFTHLELLCLDQGLSPSFCRSRYSGP